MALVEKRNKFHVIIIGGGGAREKKYCRPLRFSHLGWEGVDGFVPISGPEVWKEWKAN